MVVKGENRGGEPEYSSASSKATIRSLPGPITEPRTEFRSFQGGGQEGVTEFSGAQAKVGDYRV